MTIKCLNQSALEFSDGSSDKLYIVQVQEHDLGAAGLEYTAVGYYGRRGATLTRTEKYKGASVASANAAANKLIKEKIGKGYSTMALGPGVAVTGMPSSAPVFGGASAVSSSTVTPRPVTGPLPMLAAPLEDDDEKEALIESQDWVMMRKYDGERCLVSLRRSGITATNRNGQPRSLTAPVEAELKRLLALPDFGDERETIVDGELMGDVYVIYNLITLRDVDVRKLTFDERYSALEELLKDNLGLLGDVSWGEAEKRATLALAESEDWEGVMFLDINGAYTSNRSPALRKYKLWATCTCRVLTLNAKRSVQVALLDETGNEVFSGNVTIAVNQDLPELDALIEVRYLYAMDGGSLYQPKFLRVRNDIDEADLRSSLRPAPPEKRGISAATV